MVCGFEECVVSLYVEKVQDWLLLEYGIGVVIGVGVFGMFWVLVDCDGVGEMMDGFQFIWFVIL